MKIDNRREIEIDLPIEMWHNLMEEAHRRDITLNNLVNIVLKEYIKKHKGNTVTVKFTTTECYCSECPFHDKDEPFGYCFAQKGDERFKMACDIIRKFYGDL